MARICERCGGKLISGGLKLGGVTYNFHAKKCPTDAKTDLKISRSKWNGSFRGKPKTMEILPDYKLRRSGLAFAIKD